MKYILVASLLSSAVFAAPLAQAGNGKATGNAATNQQAGAATQQQGGAAQQQAGAATGATQQQGAQNVNTGLGAGAVGTNGQTPTAGDLATAVSNWMADTSMVSNFLNTTCANTHLSHDSDTIMIDDISRYLHSCVTLRARVLSLSWAVKSSNPEVIGSLHVRNHC